MFKKIKRALKSGGVGSLFNKARIHLISSHRVYGFSPWPLTAEVLDTHPDHLVVSSENLALSRSFNQRHSESRISCKKPVRIAWFLPDFDAGSGGHMNIFRCQKYLKKQHGIVSANVMYPGRSSASHSQKMAEFYHLKAKKAFPAHYDDTPFLQNEKELKEYSVMMATSWPSVFGILNIDAGLLRTYFIQDYEPFFYGEGARTHFAKQTYEFGFFPICAGPWISKKLKLEERVVQHIEYSLSTDLERYQEVKGLRARQGICFYLRSHTERRGYELAIGVIHYLQKFRAEIEISTIGMSADDLRWLNGCHHYGSKPVSELPAIYCAHRAFGVFSFSNYSLLPAEIISCGGRIVDVDLENNQTVKALFPSSHYFLVIPEVEMIALKLAAVHDLDPSDNASQLVQWKKSFGGWDEQYKKIGDGLNQLFGKSS